MYTALITRNVKHLFLFLLQLTQPYSYFAVKMFTFLSTLQILFLLVFAYVAHVKLNRGSNFISQNI